MDAARLKQLKKLANIELAKKDFFHYCNLVQPKFFKYDREYLKTIAKEMQGFYESEDEEFLVINAPPRHGKSLSAMRFAQWVFGKNPREKIMTGSYNEDLSTKFARGVRNAISESKGSKDVLVFGDIFPDSKVKYGESSMSLWSLEGQHDSYLATSPKGKATGFGATLLIIDDLIKNAKEANNANVLEEHWDWFTNTMFSRLEEGGKVIVIMTRWSSKDLAGRVLDFIKEYDIKARHINLKAQQDDGTMLCEEVLSKQSFELKTKAMSHEIAMANYQQQPIDIKGRLYGEFKIYDGELPRFKEIRNYTDTADTGSDYLASINYGVTFNDEAYILDVLYTQESMEITEEKHARMLKDGGVNIADIESNNGGRGYARNVERILRTKYNTNKVVIRPFHQSKNKQSRILSASSWIMEHVYMPSNWRHRFPDFHDTLMTYQKAGKNAHDDAPDALTGIYDKMNTSGGFESW